MKIASVFDPENVQRFIFDPFEMRNFYVKRNLILIDVADMVSVKVKRWIASITVSDTWPILEIALYRAQKVYLTIRTL